MRVTLAAISKTEQPCLGQKYVDANLFTSSEYTFSLNFFFLKDISLYSRVVNLIFV